MRFELFVASRYLRAKRRQAVVGVITTISIIGVAAGVASLILALAITNGMQRDLQNGLLSSTAQVQLMRVANDGIDNWRSLTDRLRHLPHVTAAAPALYGQVLISRGARSGGALIKGILPKEERTVSSLLDDIKQGTAAPLAPEASQDSTGTLPPVVLGSDLADQIGAGVGDSVLVTSPQGELTPYGLVPKYERFQVVGIFHSGFYQYDSSFALARLTDIQHLFSEPNIVSAISFKVDDLYHADRIGKAIEQAAGRGFMTTN
ncbi:MAG: ABC transporter permease, partial [Acidobacteriaceae bacterium]